MSIAQTYVHTNAHKHLHSYIYILTYASVYTRRQMLYSKEAAPNSLFHQNFVQFSLSLTNTYLNIHMYTHARTQIYSHIYTCIRTQIQMHTHTYTHVYAHIYTQYIHIRTNMLMHVHMYTHTYTQKYSYVYTCLRTQATTVSQRGCKCIFIYIPLNTHVAHTLLDPRSYPTRLAHTLHMSLIHYTFRSYTTHLAHTLLVSLIHCSYTARRVVYERDVYLSVYMTCLRTQASTVSKRGCTCIFEDAREKARVSS